MPSYPPFPPSPNLFLIMSVPLGPKGQAVCGTHLSREVKVGGRKKGGNTKLLVDRLSDCINLDKMVVIQNDPAILAQVEQVHFSDTVFC